jgi:hypothetical protein
VAGEEARSVAGVDLERDVLAQMFQRLFPDESLSGAKHE